MNILMVFFFVILLAAIALVAYAATIYNNLVRVKRSVDQAWANIDVLLKQRHDEIPKLIDAVRGYMTYEKELLQSVTSLRTQAAQAGEGQARVQAEGQLGATLGRLFAVAENYPDLKANENFLELQQELANTENRIQAGRRFYNVNIKAYNTRIAQVPFNFLAGIFGFKKRDFFEIKEAKEAENVKTDFTNRP